MVDFQPVQACCRRFTLLKVVAYPPLAVFRNAAALLLRERSEDGKHQLAIPAHGVNVLFLKVNVYASPFNSHTVSSSVTVFRANRLIDLAMNAPSRVRARINLKITKYGS